MKTLVQKMADTETARAIDSLKCDVSVQETLLNYANKVVETEKKKVAVVAHDSKVVLNSLLEDIQEVRVVIGLSRGGVVSWLVGCCGVVASIYDDYAFLFFYLRLLMLYVVKRLCIMFRRNVVGHGRKPG